MQDRVEDLNAGGARELAQLGHRILRGGARAGERAHQQGASFAAHATAGGRARHLLLEREHRCLRIELEILERGRLLEAVQFAAFVERQKRRQIHLAGQPVVARDHGGDGVQTEENEVGQIVARQRLVLQMRVHQAQAAQAELAGTRAADVRQLDLPRIADQHVFDFPASVEKDADLPARVARHLGEMTSQFGRAQLARLDAPAVGREQTPGLASLQSRCVAVQIVSRTVRPRCAVQAP